MSFWLMFILPCITVDDDMMPEIGRLFVTYSSGVDLCDRVGQVYMSYNPIQ